MTQNLFVFQPKNLELLLHSSISNTDNTGVAVLFFVTETFWSFSHSCNKTCCKNVHYPIFSDILTEMTFRSFQKNFGL